MEISVFTIISLIITIIVGAYAVLNNVSDETIEKYEKNILTKYIIAKYLRVSQKINRAIGKAVESGSIKGAFKFSAGMLYLFAYFFIVNIVLYLIKSVIYNLYGYLRPSYFDGFGFMFGAGMASFFLWFRKLHRESEEMKALAKEGKIAKSVRKFLSQNLKISILVITYLLWVLLEVVFLLLSVITYSDAETWLEYYLRFSLYLLIVYLVIIFFKILFGKARKRASQ